MSPLQLGDANFLGSEGARTNGQGSLGSRDLLPIQYDIHCIDRKVGDGALQAFWTFSTKPPVTISDDEVASAVARASAAAEAAAASQADNQDANASDAGRDSEGTDNAQADANDATNPSGTDADADADADADGDKADAPVPQSNYSREDCLGFVRQLTPLGSLKLVPLQEGYPAHDFDPRTTDVRIVTGSELSKIRKTKFGVKINWFRALLSKIGSSKKLLLEVSRDSLLRGSFVEMMKAGPSDMYKMLRVRFVGEDAIDVGGVQREWFELLAEQIFQPESQLFSQCSCRDGSGTSSLSGVYYDIVQHHCTVTATPPDPSSTPENNDPDESGSGGGGAANKAAAAPKSEHPLQAAISNFMEVGAV